MVLALVLGRDWMPKAETPEPVDDVPVRALDPGAGQLRRPRGPGSRPLPRAVRLPAGDGLPDVEIDVPAGWGQDDDSALATAPSSNSSARRIDLVGRVLRVESNPCSPEWARPAAGTLGLARALSSVPRAAGTAPAPVTLDGHQGYVVRLTGPRTHDAFLRCTHGSLFQLYLHEEPWGSSRPAGPAGSGCSRSRATGAHQRQSRSGRHPGPGGRARRDGRVHLLHGVLRTPAHVSDPTHGSDERSTP